MAYDKNKIYELAQEQIKKNNLFFVEDIVAFLPISKPTFYDYFPLDSNEFNTIKELLYENKIKTKSGIRAKLYKGKESGLIALYKLIGTNEERKKLSQTYQDVTTNGKEINQTNIIVKDKETKSEIEKLINETD